jgi:hypothetical protein
MAISTTSLRMAGLMRWKLGGLGLVLAVCLAPSDAAQAVVEEIERLRRQRWTMQTKRHLTPRHAASCQIPACHASFTTFGMGYDLKMYSPLWGGLSAQSI